MEAISSDRVVVPGRVAVVAALREEIEPLRRRLGGRRTLRRAGPRCELGRLGSHEVVLAATGDGAEAARQGLERLLELGSVCLVIAVGVAGGLSHGLTVGSLVVAREVRNGTGALPPPDPAWLARALRRPGAQAGIVLSTDEIAVDAAAKRRLGATLPPAEPGVVDLESAAFGRLAAERGLPYLVARAVSDRTDETLPLDFNRFRDARGGVRRGRVTLYALTRPALWGPLADLRRRVAHCAVRLAELTEAVLS